MSNHTWACFDCRVAVRRSAAHEGAVKCPECAAPCENLGRRIPVPPKDKPKEWTKVRAHLTEVRREKAARRAEGLAVQKTFLEGQIAKLEKLPANPGRAKEIKLLRERLAALKAR